MSLRDVFQAAAEFNSVTATIADFINDASGDETYTASEIRSEVAGAISFREKVDDVRAFLEGNPSTDIIAQRILALRANMDLLQQDNKIYTKEQLKEYIGYKKEYECLRSFANSFDENGQPEHPEIRSAVWYMKGAGDTPLEDGKFREAYLQDYHRPVYVAEGSYDPQALNCSKTPNMNLEFRQMAGELSRDIREFAGEQVITPSSGTCGNPLG